MSCMENHTARDAHDTTGPVAGEALKDCARWPGFGLIAIGRLALALSLTGFAVGRKSLATVGAGVAVVAITAGVLWHFAEHRRPAARHGAGTPSGPKTRRRLAS